MLPGLRSSSQKVGFKKCAKEESISRFGKTGSSKSGKSSSANPFSGSVGTSKKGSIRINYGSDDNNEDNSQKNGHCSCMKEGMISGVKDVGYQTADDGLRDMERK